MIETKELIQVRDSTGKWLNSRVFSQEGLNFIDNGYYITDPAGTTSWKEYWDEQLRRCNEGYEVNGSKITGHHYEYLNFTQISAIENKSVDTTKSFRSRTAKKKIKCPDFWDGDYDYYWSLEIAKNGILNEYSLASTTLEKELASNLDKESRKELAVTIVNRLKLRVKPHHDYLDGGYHFIVGKSRRKGYSYKNASICSNTYNTIRNSLTIIGAFDKKYLYPNGTMGMASNQLSFLNEFTAWSKAREFVDKQEHRRASFNKTVDGKPVESGYLSEIMAITFKDNPDAARGKNALYVLFEEAGRFPNLKAAYNATAPGLTAGDYITGQMLIFGTGGDMEVGTADFAAMFYNPIEYGLMPFINVWDENAENSVCGFFHPVYLNMEGYYDEQGNSDAEGALQAELVIRDNLRKNATSTLVLQQRVQEFCTCPSEAFLTVSTNDFPIVELRQQRDRVLKDKLHIKIGKAVVLTPEFIIDHLKTEKVINPFTGKPEQVRARRRIKIEIDLNNRLDPLWSYRPTTKNISGAVVIYEAPVNNPPIGLYKIGHDPYRHVSSSLSLPSLASIYVYKTVKRGDATKNIIVAQYVGRPPDPDDVNRTLEMLAELYNTEIMYENEVTHVKDYFKRRNKLHLLAAQPNAVISNAIKNSNVARVYGIHMNEKLKDAGEKYIKKWLLTERDTDENGNVLLNLHFIYDPALLEELILYNRKGNFDRVMGFMILMFQLAEDDEGKEYEERQENTTVKGLLDLMTRQFSNS